MRTGEVVQDMWAVSARNLEAVLFAQKRVNQIGGKITVRAAPCHAG